MEGTLFNRSVYQAKGGLRTECVCFNYKSRRIIVKREKKKFFVIGGKRNENYGRVEKRSE